jgi:His-Xaa-Ser system protein HxsD
MADTGTIIIELDPAVYRLSAIKKAAYRFGGRCHVQITAADGVGVQVTLIPKQPTENHDSLRGEFCNEVLDQELREVVTEETAGVRNLLLAQAFSATSLLDPDGETASDSDDPLGIRRSDKHSDGKNRPPKP